MVSNLGRVKALARKGTNYNKRQDRILKPSVGKRGYHWVYLRKNNKTTTKSIHTLVLAAFKGPRPKGMEGRHLNGKPENNRLKNLVWGTPRQNQHDRISHGTDDCGVNSANAKLTWREVYYVRKSDKSQYKLAKELGVSQSTISDVQLHKSYK